MMTDFDTTLKAPFPYFGGKATVSDIVWQYLGDVKQYIEPFFGSGAVLLKRPATQHEKIYEIVNDKDGHIVNVWRSIIHSPDEVLRYCDNPVSHVDMEARRLQLIDKESDLLENMLKDPEYHDAKLAGYWIYVTSCWIGSGMMTAKGGEIQDGITSKRPHLTNDKGITSRIPHLANDKGITSHELGGEQDIIHRLQRRLRYVKVVCGDWTRVCGGNWQDMNKPVGMVFDPPYGSKKRVKDLYRHDSYDISGAVEEWVLERGANPNYRIIVCGYDDEYGRLVNAGWGVHHWKAKGGYGNLGNGDGKSNSHRECLFVSPHCLEINGREDRLF